LADAAGIIPTTGGGIPVVESSSSGVTGIMLALDTRDLLSGMFIRCSALLRLAGINDTTGNIVLPKSTKVA
jgi:hypothetical protein